jgi:glycosyltransferase involved in cell wall biosynthesis
VAVSEILEQQLKKTVVASGTMVRLIRNGVDTDQERPRPDSGKLRAELGLRSTTPVIGSIGRLERIKGYDIMVEALALLRRDWSGSEPPVLVIGGDGTEREALQQRVNELGLAKSASLLGWRDDIPDLRSAFALFTMSSRSEGTSVSLLEAMSSGLCPVVTNVGGNADVLGESLRHRLITPESPSALAEAWAVALADRDRLARDAEVARKRIQEKFSLDQMVRAYGELYLS